MAFWGRALRLRFVCETKPQLPALRSAALMQRSRQNWIIGAQQNAFTAP